VPLCLFLLILDISNGAQWWFLNHVDVVFKCFVVYESVWDLLYYHTTEIVNFCFDVKFLCNYLVDTDIPCGGAFNSSVKSYASSRWQCNSYRVKIKLKFVRLKSMHHHPLELCASLKFVASFIWLTKMVDLLVLGLNSVRYRHLKQWNEANSLAVPIKGALKRYLNAMVLQLYVDSIFPHFNLNIYIFFFHRVQLAKIACSYLKVQAWKGRFSWLWRELLGQSS